MAAARLDEFWLSDCLHEEAVGAWLREHHMLDSVPLGSGDTQASKPRGAGGYGSDASSDEVGTG